MKQLLPLLVSLILLSACGQQEQPAQKKPLQKVAAETAEAIPLDTLKKETAITSAEATKPIKKHSTQQTKVSVDATEKATDRISVLNKEESVVDEVISGGTSFIAQLRNDYLAQFPPEEFIITGRETTTITTAAGTTLTVNAKDLETLDGKSFEDPIHFYIKEMVTPADMLRMHAPTMSNGEMLESGGAWYINATSYGKPLRIKQGKSIIISVKQEKQQQQKNYNVFTSDNSSETVTGSVDWQTTDQLFFNAGFSGAGGMNEGVQLYDAYRGGSKRKTYPGEIWQIHKSYVSKENKARKLFNKNDDSYKYEDYYLSELTEKQNERLDQIFTNGTIVNRRISVFGIESRVCFLFEYGSGTQGVRALVDSVATTELSPWLSKRLKTAITKKIAVFNKDYFARPAVIQATATYNMTANLRQFGWINCDRFSNYADKTFYYANIKGIDTIKNMQVYMVFKSIRSLLCANKKNINNNLFVFEKIPSRQEVMMVATGFNGTNYFAGKTDYFSLQPKGNTDVQVAQMSKEEMQSFLQKLE